MQRVHGRETNNSSKFVPPKHSSSRERSVERTSSTRTHRAVHIYMLQCTSEHHLAARKHTHTHKHAISASRPPGFSGCSNRHTEEKKKNAMCEKNNPSQGMVSIGSNKHTYNKVTMQFQTMEGKRLMGKQNTITTTTARMIQTWPTSYKNGQNRQAQWDRAHTTTMAERHLSTCSSTAARPHLLMAHLVALLIRNVSPRHGDVQPDESKQSSTVGERATEV